MNTNLLKAIRKIKKRIADQENKKTIKYEPPAKYHSLKYALLAPTTKNNEKLIIIDSVGDKSDKSFKAINTLTPFLKKNFPEHKILTCSEPTLYNKGAKVARFIAIIFQLIYIKLRLKKSRIKDKNLISAVYGYTAFKRFFSKNPDSFPIVISDLSPCRVLMQYSSQESLGILWWQDDPHYSPDTSIKYNGASLIKPSHINTIQLVNPNAKIHTQNLNIPEKISKVTNNPRVAIAVNAEFIFSDKQIEKLLEVKTKFSLDYISIRLHPTVKLDKKYIIPNWIIVKNPNQTIDDFAKEYDLLIVGNSAIQLKILCSGRAVAHIEGLDYQDYDLYTYVRKGLIYGEKLVSDINIYQLNKHYEKSNFIALLKQEMGDL